MRHREELTIGKRIQLHSWFGRFHYDCPPYFQGYLCNHEEFGICLFANESWHSDDDLQRGLGGRHSCLASPFVFSLPMQQFAICHFAGLAGFFSL